MALKNFNPTTPSRRSLVLVDKTKLHKEVLLKNLPKGFLKQVEEIIRVEQQCGGRGRS